MLRIVPLAVIFLLFLTDKKSVVPGNEILQDTWRVNEGLQSQWSVHSGGST